MTLEELARETRKIHQPMIDKWVEELVHPPAAVRAFMDEIAKSIPPRTRWQRFCDRWADRWDRAKDAWAVLRGNAHIGWD